MRKGGRGEIEIREPESEVIKMTESGQRGMEMMQHADGDMSMRRVGRCDIGMMKDGQGCIEIMEGG